MKNRSYNQFCALAFALDIIGERWTLLVIRELLTGPRRFKDLMDGLPDISTNLLTDRLKMLEGHGIINRRVLPPPAGSTVYELTEVGMALESAVIELGRWGSRFLPASPDGLALPSMGTAALALKAFFRPETAENVDETFEVHLDGEVFQLHVHDGRLHIQQGQRRKPTAIIHTTMYIFMGLFAGQIPPEAAIMGNLVRIEGDANALQRLLNYSSVQAAA